MAEQKGGSAVASFRARAFNVLLRLTSKRQLQGDLTVEAVRRQMAALGRVFDGRSVRAAVLQTPYVPVHRQGGGDRPRARTLFYLHGGAFCSHAPALYDGFTARISRRIDAVAYVPDYRLAPEHPFPAAVDDCLNAYRWLLDQGTDPRRTVLAGDSAGGCLVLTTLQQARDQGLPLPACAVLLSPATDLTASSRSFRRNEPADPIFTARAMLYFRSQYLPAGTSPTDPLVSPLHGDFHGLPPMLFHVGSTEMLLDDTLSAAERLREAGGEVEAKVWQSMPHVFQMVRWLPEAKKAMDQIAAYVVRKIP